MAKDITGIIRSLQASAVNRCRERLDEAALRSKGLISHGEGECRNQDTTREYGVTCILKRRHGL